MDANNIARVSNGTASEIPGDKAARPRTPDEVIARVSDAFLALDRDWRYTYVNAQAGWLFGRRPEELIGKNIWAEFPEGIGRESHRAYEKAMKEQQAVFLEEYYPPLDRWFENRIYPSADGLTVYLHDVTERKNDEALLNGQRKVLEMIAAGAPLLETLAALVRVIEARLPEMLCTMLLLDGDGRHLRHGVAPSLPAAFLQGIDGAAIGPRAGSCGTAAFRGEPVIVEDIATDPLWEDYRALALAHGLRACWSIPILDPARRILGTFAIYYRQPGRPTAPHERLIEIATHVAAVAISHERAQTALRLSESRHRKLFEYAPDGIVIADGESRYLDANASMCRMLGYKREELIGLHASDIVVQAEVAHIGPALEAIRTGADYHRVWQFRRKDGSVFTAEVIATTMPDGNLLAMIRDITESKRADAALRLFRTLVDQSNDAFEVIDPETGGFLDVNDKACVDLGYSRAEYLMLRLADIDPTIGPSGWEEKARKIRAAGALSGDGVHRRKDGTTFPVEFSAKWVQLDRDYIVTVVRDITGRKELEAQLMRMQRMESVGRMAGGVAHDLNNILAPILMGVPLLRMGLPPAQTEKILATTESSARRGADLVKQLLMFARGIEGRRTMVRLQELVQEMATMMRETFPKNIAITTEIPGDLWPLLGDATQLHQVLLNLCVNARDAMPKGGGLKIAAENIHIDESYASMSPEAKPGTYACLGVTDTGTGIPPEILDKIFDPFFTTKETGKGTGLGLSTVVGIVKNHGGFVSVRSEVGKGSTFEVFLPAEPGAKEPPVATDARLAPMGQGEMILLVDDEANICAITGKTLEQYGYRVLTAGDGADACAQFARHLAEVKIVVTDIDMPVMGGVALIQVLKKMNPAIRIIVSSGKTSGLADKVKLAAANDLRVDSILSKPYTAEKILLVIHDLLASRPS